MAHTDAAAPLTGYLHDRDLSDVVPGSGRGYARAARATTSGFVPQQNSNRSLTTRYAISVGYSVITTGTDCGSKKFGRSPGMHASVSRLKGIMAPSPLPEAVSPPWDDIESACGVRLPSDYRDFIDNYGNGRIGELYVLYPASRRLNGEVRLTSLIDNAQDLVANQVFDYDDDGNPLVGYPEPGGLLQWGGSTNGDMFFWVTEGEDPDGWTVLAHLHGPAVWARYDGNMVDFLTELVTGEYLYAPSVLGSHAGHVLWTMISDWKHRYGGPPEASLHGGDDRAGVQLSAGSPLPWRRVEISGGDQDVFGRTGEVVPLIAADGATTIRLGGGGLAPGIAYRLFAWAHTDEDAEADLLEIVCDGMIVARGTLSESPRSRMVEGRILVPANTPDAVVQIRVRSEKPAVTLRTFYLTINGTLGN
ncbi:SMI1/KNR4 family protein [Nocardia nova]|uniref:SMI1/KNR4 family protein n=1 Tax=Nocardia nova TaxID=37330 RepID=UPI0015E435F8|nr:SMI1/KNR4 family protein [Nocardia nova]